MKWLGFAVFCFVLVSHMCTSLLQNVALWHIMLVHCEICATGLLMRHVTIRWFGEIGYWNAVCLKANS